MTDRVRSTFLEAQHEAAVALAASSGILDLTPLEGRPPDRYIADFRCRGLVRDGDTVLLAERFIIGIRIPDDYLRTFRPEQVLTVLAPLNIWLPNIRGPLLCPGHMAPGTPLVDLLFQIHEVLAGQRLTLDEKWALNPLACAWARDNRHMFPVDPRPLVRRHVGGDAGWTGPPPAAGTRAPASARRQSSRQGSVRP